jgi:PAS domain S-box-containing protein
MRDVTDHKRAEAAAAQLAAIVQSSDDAIIGKNLDGVITSWNAGAEKIFGYAAPEIVGQSIRQLIPPDRQQEEVKILECIKRGDSIRHFDTIRLRKDGSAIDISITTSAIKDPAGKIIGASKVARDITERKAAEAKIRQLNVELEQRVLERTAELESFSYSVSHDLRAPVRAIGGFARILQEDHAAALAPEAQRLLGRIHDNAQKMGQLIDGLLAFSRLGRQPLNKQPVMVSALVHRALEELQPEHAGRRIKISVTELPDCQADPTLLQQVYTNLLSNAFKYSRDRNPAIIEIGSRDEKGRRVYFVKDNGAGFEMDYAHKLFGVFQRLHRADQFEGTGVGLAIVQRIIHRHGGQIWADAAPGKGAMFSFTLEPKNVYG